MVFILVCPRRDERTRVIDGLVRVGGDGHLQPADPVQVERRVRLADADARILGRQPGDHAGNAVDASADIDGDGRRDVLVGAYIDDSAAINAGAAYLVLGPWSGTSYLTDAEGGFIGESEADLAGWAVELTGDLDGGGVEDVVIGAPGGDHGADEGGVVYLISSEGLVF